MMRRQHGKENLQEVGREARRIEIDTMMWDGKTIQNKKRKGVKRKRPASHKYPEYPSHHQPMTSETGNEPIMPP